MQTALIDALNSYADASGGGEGVFETPIPGFGFMRTSRETLPHHIVYKPSLCIVAQGEKQVLFEDSALTYREMQALIVSVEIPALGRVTKATPGEAARRHGSRTRHRHHAPGDGGTRNTTSTE